MVPFVGKSEGSRRRKKRKEETKKERRNSRNLYFLAKFTSDWSANMKKEFRRSNGTAAAVEAVEKAI